MQSKHHFHVGKYRFKNSAGRNMSFMLHHQFNYILIHISWMDGSMQYNCTIQLIFSVLYSIVLSLVQSLVRNFQLPIVVITADINCYLKLFIIKIPWCLGAVCVCVCGVENKKNF